MPVADDIRLVDGRYQRYVGHGESVHPGYKSEAHRRRSVLVGNLALAAMPLGLGAGALHIGLKGSRWNRAAGTYQAIKAEKFYSPSAARFFTIRKFVSPAARKVKKGLPGRTVQAAKAADYAIYSIGKKVREAPIIGGAVRLHDKVSFIRNPVHTVAKRLPIVGTGILAHHAYGRVKSLYDSYIYGDMPGDPGDPRVPIIFNAWDGQGEPLPPRRIPSSPQQRKSESKSRSRCPPGHRWSSKSRKCVPYARKRS